MAAAKKKAARRQATIAFLDESGLLMAPLVRRSWAPQGHTPVIHQRTRARDKVSIVAVISLSPRRRRLRLSWAVYPNANINAPLLVDFLKGLTRHLRGPILLIWDRLGTHRARAVHDFLRRHPRVRSVLLPPYAPELNPPEYFWGYLKRNPLANQAASGASQLAHEAARHARRIARRQDLLRSFIHATGLPLRLR